MPADPTASSFLKQLLAELTKVSGFYVDQAQQLEVSSFQWMPTVAQHQRCRRQGSTVRLVDADMLDSLAHWVAKYLIHAELWCITASLQFLRY